MAPIAHKPVSEAAANAGSATDHLPIIASFQSTCSRHGTRSFTARKPEIASRLLPAFGILAQGSQLRVPDGSAAVEDLSLGDMVCNAAGDAVEITWIGTVTLCANALETPWLRRVQPGRFGFARPLSDVILGAEADIVLDPVADLSRSLDSYGNDDMIVSLAPPSPVRLFQIGCAEPTSVSADGLLVRTLDVQRFLEDQPELLAQMFSKLVPGKRKPAADNRFVTASPFRRARLA